MQRNENEWCHYHRCKGHDTKMLPPQRLN
jgi:hypothetical protein